MKVHECPKNRTQFKAALKGASSVQWSSFKGRQEVSESIFSDLIKVNRTKSDQIKPKTDDDKKFNTKGCRWWNVRGWGLRKALKQLNFSSKKIKNTFSAFPTGNRLYLVQNPCLTTFNPDGQCRLEIQRSFTLNRLCTTQTYPNHTPFACCPAPKWPW